MEYIINIPHYHNKESILNYILSVITDSSIRNNQIITPTTSFQIPAFTSPDDFIKKLEQLFSSSYSVEFNLLPAEIDFHDFSPLSISLCDRMTELRQELRQEVILDDSTISLIPLISISPTISFTDPYCLFISDVYGVNEFIPSLTSYTLTFDNGSTLSASEYNSSIFTHYLDDKQDSHYLLLQIENTNNFIFIYDRCDKVHTLDWFNDAMSICEDEYMFIHNKYNHFRMYNKQDSQYFSSDVGDIYSSCPEVYRLIS